MNKLLQIYKRLLDAEIPIYQRAFYDNFAMDSRFIGIVGARGVGKTTFLLNHLRQNYSNNDKGLYVSADNLYFTDNTLFDLADKFTNLYGGQLLCIDEVHKYKNWNQELKNIYDSFPNLKIIFSGSSSINLIKGRYDLSRRAQLKPLYGFSFREYLEIKTKQKYSPLTLSQILTGKFDKNLLKTEKIIGHLHNYWQTGYYPMGVFLKEKVFADMLIAIIDKVIYEDISSFYPIKTQNLDSMRKLIYFFATSSPGNLSINKLANSTGKDNATIAEYVQILRDTGLLRFLLIDKRGHSLLRNAEKIYIDNTNLLYAINSAIGKEANLGSLRELFIITALENAGFKVAYSSHGDISCDGHIFEIGGKTKDFKQIKGAKNSYLVKDEVIYPSLRTIPLYLFGFLS